MTDTVLVTAELLEKGKSPRGGWTKAQTLLLGEPWPIAPGWIRRVVGREIPRVDADRFVSLGTDATDSADQQAAARRLADRQIPRREAAKDKALDRLLTAMEPFIERLSRDADRVESDGEDRELLLAWGALGEMGHGSRPEAAGPDPDFADEDLLRRAVGHLGVIARRRQPRWAVAMDLFATGSTSAARLCLRFGFDPDSEIGPSERELVERALIFSGIEPPEKHER